MSRVDEEVRGVDEWSVLVKVARPPGGSPIARTELDALVRGLPGTDHGVTGGDGLDATISLWIEAGDAAGAISEAWRLIEAQRLLRGMDAWRPIRTHAASAAQRLTGFEGVDSRVNDEQAWSVLMKATLPAAAEPPTEGFGARVQERLGPDASVAGNDHTLVARYWVSALDPVAADAAARDVLLSALGAVDRPERWAIVRAHHAVASERAEEIYHGAAERVARSVR